MINAVLFDLYETLITESGLQPTRASSLAAALGLQDGAYRVEWKLRRPRVVLGQISFANALSEISQTVIGRVNTAAVQRICEQRIREKAAACARIDDEVAAMIKDLVRRGIRLAVISNGFKEDVVPWPTCVLAREFQCSVFSSAEGVAKPDSEIYLRAIRRLEVQAATAVYIGDGGDDELAGAEQAGLRACRAAWFVRNSPQKETRPPELARPGDVLKFVAAG
jgi:HAD superfamily hydrolase (TIGR01549 family)